MRMGTGLSDEVGACVGAVYRSTRAKRGTCSPGFEPGGSGPEPRARSLASLGMTGGSPNDGGSANDGGSPNDGASSNDGGSPMTAGHPTVRIPRLPLLPPLQPDSHPHVHQRLQQLPD